MAPSEDELRAVVEEACEASGLSVEQYRAALAEDHLLRELLDKALDELTGAPPDPGPYDVISRESPKGSPETFSESVEQQAKLLGRSPKPRG